MNTEAAVVRDRYKITLRVRSLAIIEDLLETCDNRYP